MYSVLKRFLSILLRIDIKGIEISKGMNKLKEILW